MVQKILKLLETSVVKAKHCRARSKTKCPLHFWWDTLTGKDVYDNVRLVLFSPKLESNGLVVFCGTLMGSTEKL